MCITYSDHSAIKEIAISRLVGAVQVSIKWGWFGVLSGNGTEEMGGAGRGEGERKGTQGKEIEEKGTEVKRTEGKEVREIARFKPGTAG
jgi:hypothetical protein